MLGPFVVLGVGAVRAVPQVLQRFLGVFPALHKIVRPNTAGDAEEGVKGLVQGGHEVTRLYELVDLKYKNSRPKHSRHRQPSLIVYQKGKFETITFAIVVLDDIERVHVLLEVAEDEATRQLEVVLAEDLVEIVDGVALVQREVLLYDA